MNTNSVKVCFTCGRDCGQEFLVLPHRGEDFGLRKSSKYVCATCFIHLNTSIALISVTDGSFKVQGEAVVCHYKRLKAGQKTPYPKLLVRTGLTLFVKECYITKGAERDKGGLCSAQVACVDAAVSSILERRWMFIPDSVYDDEGLVKELPDGIVADWRTCREDFKRMGY